MAAAGAAAPAAPKVRLLLEPVLRLETLSASATRTTLGCTYLIVLISIALSLGIQLGYNESTVYTDGNAVCPPVAGDAGANSVSLIGCLSRPAVPAPWMGSNTTQWTGIVSGMDRLAGAVKFGVAVPATTFAGGALGGSRSTVTVFSYDAAISGMDEPPSSDGGGGSGSWDPSDPSWQVLGALRNATASLTCFQPVPDAPSIECTFSPLLDSSWLSFGQPGGGYTRYLVSLTYHNLNLTAYLSEWVGTSAGAPPVTYSLSFETAAARVADAVVRFLLLLVALLYTGAWFARMCRLSHSALEWGGTAGGEHEGIAPVRSSRCCSRGLPGCRGWLPQQRIIGLMLIGLSLLWLNPLGVITGFITPGADEGGGAASSLFQHTTASMRLAAAVLETVAVVGLYCAWWSLVDRMKVPAAVIEGLYLAGPTAAAGVDGLGSPAARARVPGSESARTRGSSYGVLSGRGGRAASTSPSGHYLALPSTAEDGSSGATPASLPRTRCAGCNRGCGRCLRHLGCCGRALRGTYASCCCCRCGTVAVTDLESPMAGVKAYPSTGWGYFAPKLSLFVSLAIVASSLLLLSEPTLLFCSREAWAGVPGAACPSNPFNGPSRSVALLYTLVALALLYVLLLAVWLFAFAHASFTTSRQLARLPYAATRHVQLGYRFLMWQQAIVIGFVVVSQAVPAITFLVQYGKHPVTSTDNVGGGSGASTQLLVSSLIRSFVSSATVPLGEALLITSCTLMMAWAFLPAAARGRPAGASSASALGSGAASKATPRSPRPVGAAAGFGGGDSSGGGTGEEGLSAALAAFASGDDPQAAVFEGSTLDLSRVGGVSGGAAGGGEGGSSSGASNLIARSASTFFKTLFEPLKLGFGRSSGGGGEGAGADTGDLTFLDPLPPAAGGSTRPPPPPPYVPHFSVGTAAWLFDLANAVYFDPPPEAGFPRTPSSYGQLSSLPHGLLLEGVVANDATHSVAWILRDGWRVIVAFRGTSSRINITTDLKIGRGAVAFGEAGGDIAGLSRAGSSSTPAAGASGRSLGTRALSAARLGSPAGVEEAEEVALDGGAADATSAGTRIQHAIVSHLPGVRDVTLPRIHSGFWGAYTSIRIPLTAVVRTALASAGPHARLFTTGHSLGGALAQLAAFDLSPLVTTHREACEELRRKAQEARRARRAAAEAAARSSRRLSNGSGGAQGSTTAAAAVASTPSAGAGDFIRSMGSGLASFGRSLFSRKGGGSKSESGGRAEALRQPLLPDDGGADGVAGFAPSAAGASSSSRGLGAGAGLAVPALPRPLPAATPAPAPAPSGLPPLPKPTKAAPNPKTAQDDLFAWYDAREAAAVPPPRRGSGSSVTGGGAANVSVSGTGVAAAVPAPAGGAGRRPSDGTGSVVSSPPAPAPAFADAPGSAYHALLSPCSLGPAIEDDDHEYTAYPDSDDDEEGGGLISGDLLTSDLETGPRAPSAVPLPGYPDVTVYTFGQPRVGNPEFAAQYEARVPLTFRIVVDGDAVSGVPRALSMPLCGLKLRLYKHAGVECWVDLYGNVIVGPSIVERTFRASSRLSLAAHRMASYKRALQCARRNEGRPAPPTPAGTAATPASGSASSTGSAVV